jgi:hypothetical protein
MVTVTDVASIDELGTLMKFIDVVFPPNQPHPIVQLLEQMWPVFQKLFDMYGDTVRTSESLARFFRHVLESSKIHFASLLPKLLPCLIQGLERTKLSCYIWVCAKVVRVFGRKQEYVLVLNQLVQSVTQTVFQMVQNPSLTDPEPEMIIEEFHYLLSMYIDAATDAFLDSPLLNSTCECAVYCLGTTLEIANTAVLRFIVDVFELGQPQNGNPQRTQIISALMEQYGLPLVANLFKCIIYNFSKVQGVTSDVAEIFLLCLGIVGKEKTIQVIHACVEQFPIQEMSIELKGNFMLKIQR